MVEEKRVRCGEGRGGGERGKEGREGLGRKGNAVNRRVEKKGRGRRMREKGREEVEYRGEEEG